MEALYANATDYDLEENAYSASVAQVKKGEDAEEKEREREAKRRRKEEAAALREKMKAEEAERRARARAEAEKAAAAAAEERARQLAEREAAEAHAAAVAAAKAAAVAQPAGPEAVGDDDDDAPAPAKRPVGRPRGSSNAKEAKAHAHNGATGASVQVVAAFSDDFAGLYASRAVDDRARAELDAESGTGAGILTYNLELRGAPFADSRTPPAIPSPHVSVPAGATLGVVKKIVGSQCGCSDKRVMIFGGEPGAEVVLDASTSVRTALWPQLTRNGSNELVLLYALQ